MSSIMVTNMKGRSAWSLVSRGVPVLILGAFASIACESSLAPDDDPFVEEQTFGQPLVEFWNLGSWAWLPYGTELVVAFYGDVGADLRAIDVESRSVRQLAPPPDGDGLIFDVQVCEPFVYYEVTGPKLYRVRIDGSADPELVYAQAPCHCSVWENWSVSPDHLWLGYQLTIFTDDTWAFWAVVTNLETGAQQMVERPASHHGRLSLAPDGTALVDANDRISLVQVPSGETVEVHGPDRWDINEFEIGFSWTVLVSWEGADAVARYALGDDFFEHRIGSEPVVVTSIADLHDGNWSSSFEAVAGWRSRCTRWDDRWLIHRCLASEHVLVAKDIRTGTETELGRILSLESGPFLFPPVFAPGDRWVAFEQRSRTEPVPGVSGLYVAAF